MKTGPRLTGGACALLSVALAGCFTFETTLPGTLDMRKELAKPQDAPLEPKRGAFGDSDDSYFEGMVFTESTDAPTKGEYVNPTSAEAGGVAVPAAPKNATIYRRIMRQWFIIGLFPILADPDKVTTDLKAELAKPGTKATHIRIISGMDILDNVRMFCLSYIPIVNFTNIAPSRTTEVIAFIERGGAADTTAPPPEAGTPATPDTPATPALPDAPVNPDATGGDDASE